VINLRDVFSLVFHSIIICNFLLSWHVLDSLNCLVFCDTSFVGNVFDSGFTFHDLLGLNYLNLLLNHLHRLLNNLDGLLDHLGWLLDVLNGLVCFNWSLNN